MSRARDYIFVNSIGIEISQILLLQNNLEFFTNDCHSLKLMNTETPVCAGKGHRHTHGPAFPIPGGQYLTVSAAKASGGKAARLVLPLGHLMHSGDLCLSFRHKVTGLHSGTLQVFVRKHGAHGAALWGRNGGHGWRQTQITLRGADVKSVSRSQGRQSLGSFPFIGELWGLNLKKPCTVNSGSDKGLWVFLGLMTPFILLSEIPFCFFILLRYNL